MLNTNPIEFTIDKSQQSFAIVTATNSLKTGEVELLKVDEFGDKKPLKGAVFKIVDVNNNDVRTDLTTDADGKQKLISYVLVRINLLKQLLLNITFYEQNLLNLQSIEVRKKLYL